MIMIVSTSQKPSEKNGATGTTDCDSVRTQKQRGSLDKRADFALLVLMPGRW